MALNQQQLEAIQQDIDDTRPVSERVDEQMEGLKSLGTFVKDTAIESTPVVGEAIIAKDISDDVSEGNYLSAGLNTAALGVGALPIVGDVLNKPLRAAAKKFRNVEPLEIGASEIAQKGTFLKNYNKSTINNIKQEASKATAGTKKADALIDAEVLDGTKVGIRLNLNSTIPNMPRGLDKLQTLHKNNYNGKALSYRPFATVEDVTFNVNQKGRQGIAAKVKGIDVPEAKNKFPAMSVDGKLNNTRNVLDEVDDEVVEIGFNPVSGHLFTDLSTGQAVKGADVATVVGDRVYAKGVTYVKKTDAPTPLDATDGTKLSSEVRYRFNEGGTLMKKQMEMFEDGGLMQEGGTVDPVSGNDVPVGSTQEEVRDDIPAQLSEGEFVFPADVVRFYGLEKLMEMRQNAKAGLQRMEDMGQMGNSEEATLPDDIPFDLEDLDMEDEPEYNDTMEMQVGGFVQPQGFTGIQSTQPSQFQNYQPQYVPYQAPAVSTAYQPPQQQTVPTIPSGQLPQAEQFLQAPQPGEQDLRKYVNDEGQVRMIPFVNDQPVYPIPQGFYPETEKPVEEEAPTAVTTETAKVVDRGGRDESATTPGATMSFGGILDPITGKVTNATTVNIGYSGIPGGLMGVGSAIAGILGFGDGVSLKEDQVATATSNALGKNTIAFNEEQFNSLNKLNVTSAERAEVKNVIDTVSKVLGDRPRGIDFDYGQAKSFTDNLSKVTGGKDPVKDNDAKAAANELAFGLSKLTPEEVNKFNDYMSQPANKDNINAGKTGVSLGRGEDSPGAARGTGQGLDSRGRADI